MESGRESDVRSTTRSEVGLPKRSKLPRLSRPPVLGTNNEMSLLECRRAMPPGIGMWRWVRHPSHNMCM